MRYCAILAGFLLFLTLTNASGQRKRDPLTPPEIDQLRDTALEPDHRLRLLVEFTRARLTTLEQVHVDPKIKNRGQEIHDRLQDFLDVYDELDNNIDMFADRKDDIRKPLKVIIEADTEFQAKIRALKDPSAPEYKSYQFLLQSAIETLDSSARDHLQLLSEQDEAAIHKKKEKNVRPQTPDR